jgi:hypothetical protein
MAVLSADLLIKAVQTDVPEVYVSKTMWAILEQGYEGT